MLVEVDTSDANGGHLLASGIADSRWTTDSRVDDSSVDFVRGEPAYGVEDSPHADLNALEMGRHVIAV